MIDTVKQSSIMVYKFSLLAAMHENDYFLTTASPVCYLYSLIFVNINKKCNLNVGLLALFLLRVRLRSIYISRTIFIFYSKNYS